MGYNPYEDPELVDELRHGSMDYYEDGKGELERFAREAPTRREDVIGSELLAESLPDDPRWAGCIPRMVEIQVGLVLRRS